MRLKPTCREARRTPSQSISATAPGSPSWAFMAIAPEVSPRSNAWMAARTSATSLAETDAVGAARDEVETDPVVVAS